MAGYYRNFYYHFSVIALPLTNLLSKRTKSVWTNDCQKTFDILKALLKNETVILAPYFAKEFKLAVDASDTGAGGVLLQEDSNGIGHPVSYFQNIKTVILQLRKIVCLTFFFFSILKFIYPLHPHLLLFQ